MRRSVEKIASISTLIEPAQIFDIVKADPDDNKIISCAKSGCVDYIITNDKHLLELKGVSGILIITPRELMKLLEVRLSQSKPLKTALILM